MANPFPNQNSNLDGNNTPSRTRYDHSHTKYMSGKIGKLYPCFLQELGENEHISLSPNINFRFAPTVQPLLNRINLVIDYFAVPFEAVFKEFPLFMQNGMNDGRPAPSFPKLSIDTPEKAKRMLGTNSLGDYLGIPTLVPNVTSSFRSSLLDNVDNPLAHHVVGGHSFVGNHYIPVINDDKSISALDTLISKLVGSHAAYFDSVPEGVIQNDGLFRESCLVGASLIDPISKDMEFSDANFIFSGGYGMSNLSSEKIFLCVYKSRHDRRANGINDWSFVESIEPLGFLESRSVKHSGNTLGNGNGNITVGYSVEDLNSLLTSAFEKGYDNLSLGFFSFYRKDDSLVGPSTVYHCFSPDYGRYGVRERQLSMASANPAIPSSITSFAQAISTSDSKSKGSISNDVAKSSNMPDFARKGNQHAVVTNDLVLYAGIRCEYGILLDSSDEDSYTFRAFGGNSPRISLSALPFRAYELCYNYFYRNQDLNPLTNASGQRITDQFLTDAQRSSGSDSFEYSLHNALLEKDVFTSLLTKPLVDYNPLIGIRQKENATLFDFQTHDGVVTLSNTPGVSEYQGVGTPYVGGLTGYGAVKTASVPYNELGVQGAIALAKPAGVVTSYETPADLLASMKDIIYTGISYKDIRETKCLIRYLSNMVEHGYNFSEQQLARFGISSRRNMMTSPTYLGGTSELINNGMVVNTAQSDGNALGEVGGLPTCRSTRENTIEYTAHDRCYIIGILRVVPIPVYAQALNPLFTATELTDFYQPEFDNKGYEPVFLEEITPLQSAYTATEKNVLGYAPSWHRYKSAIDVISGDMRKYHDNSVLMRDFGTEPQLDQAFIECRSEQFNSPFVVTSDMDDKFIGYVYHTCYIDRLCGNYKSRVLV